MAQILATEGLSYGRFAIEMMMLVGISFPLSLVNSPVLVFWRTV